MDSEKIITAEKAKKKLFFEGNSLSFSVPMLYGRCNEGNL
jgi:hypothetical protein